MLPASNRGVGQTIGFPDVCLTPTPAGPVPVPYPNLGMMAQAAPFSPDVKISGVNAVTMASKITLTTGDEGGVSHPMIKGPASFTMGNPLVKINGMAAISLACPSMGNNGNNPVGLVAVPSVSTVMYTLRPAEAEEESMGAAKPSLRVEGDVAVLTLERFTAATPTFVFQRLRGRGAAPLIIDLRGNPGGDRDAMLRLAGDFLAPAAPLLLEREADGDERLHRARGGERYTGPLAVLVDGATASAAELFAGLLAWHGRALVVGETTYGKPTVHRVVGGAYPCVATCFLPDGTPLGEGVEPTLKCEAKNALARALSVLLAPSSRGGGS